jgi:hypothetical protein
MTLSRLAQIGLLLFVALPSAVQAQSAEQPQAPERNPLAADNETPAAALPGEAPTVHWSASEVAAAKADCARLLPELALDYETLPPIKEGRCGAPAPILLRGLGNNPKVAVEPPATVTCAMAKALSEWLDKTVQPEAQARFGAAVVKLTNASSYVCRNRYNGSDTPLSEHALANALDVSEFLFQSGDKATVLTSWPRIVTELPPLPLPNPSRVAAMASDPPVSSVAPLGRGILTVAKAKPGAPPKPPPVATPPVPDRTVDGGEFVRKVHQGACNSFGTVLGPGSNEAHKDHFHFDMKARSRAAYCE